MIKKTFSLPDDVAEALERHAASRGVGISAAAGEILANSLIRNRIPARAEAEDWDEQADRESAAAARDDWD